MYYELLNSGDRVLSITTEFLVIERNDRSVAFYPLSMKDNEVLLNTESITIIGYSPDTRFENSDGYITKAGVHIVNF